jgi:hypothetical protein
LYPLCFAPPARLSAVLTRLFWGERAIAAECESRSGRAHAIKCSGDVVLFYGSASSETDVAYMS